MTSSVRDRTRRTARPFSPLSAPALDTSMGNSRHGADSDDDSVAQLQAFRKTTRRRDAAVATGHAGRRGRSASIHRVTLKSSSPARLRLRLPVPWGSPTHPSPQTDIKSGFTANATRDVVVARRGRAVALSKMRGRKGKRRVPTKP